MQNYCEECGREVETKVVTKKEKYEVCGETVDVEAQVLICAECGEELYCEEFDNATLTNAYNEYRRRHKLLLPEEIKKIREQYGLSQRSFARLLNWGDKTICRYENGSIQDKAHNSLPRYPERCAYFRKGQVLAVIKLHYISLMLGEQVTVAVKEHDKFQFFSHIPRSHQV